MSLPGEPRSLPIPLLLYWGRLPEPPPPNTPHPHSIHPLPPTLALPGRTVKLKTIAITGSGWVESGVHSVLHFKSGFSSVWELFSFLPSSLTSASSRNLQPVSEITETACNEEEDPGRSFTSLLLPPHPKSLTNL